MRIAAPIPKNPDSKAKFGSFTPLISKSFQIWDHFFHYFSPKDSKKLEQRTLGSGRKKTIKKKEQILKKNL